MKALKKMDINELLHRQEILDRKYEENISPFELNLTGIENVYYYKVGELLHLLMPFWSYGELCDDCDFINPLVILGKLSEVFHIKLQYINTQIKEGVPISSIYNEEVINRMRFNTVKSGNIDYIKCIEHIKMFYVNDSNLGVWLEVVDLILGSINCTMEDFLNEHHRVWSEYLKQLNSQFQ